MSEEAVPAAPKEKAAPYTGPRSYLIFVILGTAIAIATTLMVARGFLAGSYKVPSSSMVPTITNGEHILVNRTDKTAGRGKVIVFRSPEHPEQEFVKRIVGMPGDVVSMEGGRALVVNGKKTPSCTVGDWTLVDPDGARHEGQLVVESLDGSRYLVFLEHGIAATLPAGPWTVKPGEAFVIGDNRANSHDSRMWFLGEGGGVPFGSILGTVRPQGAIGLPLGAEALKEKLKACVASL
jgi:signal peptidase I